MAEGQRRLAAIMFTDMVGYTALAQSNEEQAMEVLDRHNRLLRPFFPKHHGKEVKTIGDSFLIEFDSALDAANCAIEIQRFLHDYNVSSRDEWKITLRIGIHLGDVIHQKGDVLGDAVNVASRLQPLAEPEGICVSDQIYGQIRNKIIQSLVKLPPRELKNVRFPVEIYKVLMPWEGEKSESSQELDSRRLVVLPFVSMSPNPDDEYFADGLTEELITKISLVKGLKVIARTSAMNYKREKKNASQIGKELKVGTLLEGSVRKAGNRIRVSAQLINALTEEHLWAQNYDRDLNDIFEVQSSVAENVAGALKTRLLEETKEQIERRRPRNPDAYVEYLRGNYYRHKGGGEATIRKAIECFEEVLKLEPDYPEAMAFLGLQYGSLGYYGYAPREEMYAKAKVLVSRALESDDTIPEAHDIMGVWAYYVEGDWAKAEKEVRRSLEINPSYVEAHSDYAVFLVSVGRTEESLAEIEKSLELDPLNVSTLNVAGAIYMLARRYPEAVDHHQKALEADPENVDGRTNYGLTLLVMGRIEEGVKELERAMVTGRSSFHRSNLGYAYAVAGRREDALRLAEEIRSDPNIGMKSYDLACVYAGLGDKQQALDWLEKAYEEHAIFTFPMFNIEPALASLRDEPRFKELVKKVGFDKNQAPGGKDQ